MKRYKPRTPGIRARHIVEYKDLTDIKPFKKLLKGRKRAVGINSQGRKTVRHKGAGVKKKYRIIDFKRNDLDIDAVVQSIEYDPYRTAFIALIAYKNGKKAYIIAPHKTKVGDIIKTTSKTTVNIGYCSQLKNIPVGTTVHHIELVPGKGAQICRSAGTSVLIMAKSTEFATLKMPSGEVRLVSVDCKAVVGETSNIYKKNEVIGKAGVNRLKGKRPTVRGSVMNACDHPHGGGEGRAPIGKSGPRTPWGKKANVKTRRKKSKYIIRSRKGR